MEKLLIHPATEQALEAFIKHPPHALLFVGPVGIGKLTLARYLAHRVAGVSEPEIVEPDDKGTIGIDTVRALYRSVKTKREGRQVVIIDHAEAMGDEAQNAFLKLLEEPRQGVTFILTAQHLEALLPTIISRAQQLLVRPLEDAQLRALFGAHKQISAADVTQYLFIANGRPAMLVQLLTTAEVLERERRIMLQAKEVLTSQPYVRFIMINQLAEDRRSCMAVLSAMQRMVALQLQKKANEAHMARWLNLATQLDETLQLLNSNGNIKAQLLHLFASY